MPSMPQGFSDKVRRLEDEFFLKEDAKLLARQRELRQMEESKEALAKASGIANPQVLAKLVELGIRPEIVAALTAVPLVEVAWADGAVEAREREAILRGAESLDIKPGGIEHDLLEQWLQHRPEPTLLEAWSHAVAGICESMNASEKESFRASFMAQARAVAEAAGGFLGLGRKISQSEAKVLAALEKAFA